MKKLFFSSLLFIGSICTAVAANKISELQANRFEAAIQQYCYDSYDLFTRVKRGDKENSLSTSQNNYIVHVKDIFTRDVDAIRGEFFTDQDEAAAVTHCANHLLEIAKDLRLKYYYVIPFPESVPATMLLDDQLTLIKRILDTVLPYYASLKPLPPLHKRFANAMFYNFFTTKVVPKLMIVGGGFVSAAILRYQIEKVINGFDGRLPFLGYEEIDHDRPNPSAYAHTQGASSNSLGVMLADLLKNMMDSPPVVQDKPCTHPSGVFGSASICKHVGCSSLHHGRVRHGCGDANAKCYHCTGLDLKPTPGKTFKCAWASRFTIPTLLAWYGSKLVEEAQLPEYERRIKERQKLEDEKRVENQKKFLKVNCESSVGFDKVKGQSEVIDSELRMLVDYLKHPFKYKNTSSGTRSVLLYGPPGNGKTLLARAISKESGAPFLEITADDILNENSKDKILATWRMAEEVASQRPEKSAIIYIDEIDTVVGNRSKNDNIDPQRAKALSNLLSIFDGIEKRNPYLHVVIILTTNHYENLDPALLRPGRIDRKILIGKPSFDGRKDLFQALLPKDQHTLVDTLANKTNGFSGAQVVNVIDTANMISSYGCCKRPLMSHYQQAIDRLAHEQAQMPAQ